jgi:hypothetical protein
MSTDIRSDLRVATDPASMCEVLRSRCERFGAICSIDVLPLPRSVSTGVACIVDMETAEEARAALAGLALASFGPRSLVCVVEAPRFSLVFPFRYACNPPPAAGIA